MRLRRQFVPNKIAEVGCFLLLVIFIPLTLLFELTVVLKDFHDTGSVIYIVYVVLGCFVFFNIISNLLACLLVDTSIKSVVLTPPMDNNTLRKYWHLCSVCETLVPLRSWHCQTCNTCILKRDHHCLFTGNCIGHFNHRYFILLLIYIALGSAFTTIYNSIYFWWLHGDIYLSSVTLLKMVMPMFMFTLDMSWENFYLLLYELNVITFVYSTVMIIYHFPHLLSGNVSFHKQTPKYDLGLRNNLEMIFGKRMHLAWISPFIKSELPHDGIHWETILEKSTKHR